MNNKKVYMYNKTNKNAGAKIKFSKLENTRDLGGYITTENKTLKYKKLIRSGELYTASNSDIKILQKEYNLKLIIDFRTPFEEYDRPDPIINNCINILMPVLMLPFSDDINVFASLEQKKDSLKEIIKNTKLLKEDLQMIFLDLYSKMVIEPISNRSYTIFFDKLANYPIAEDESILWHCTSGKDRTGIGTALLLSLLGVDEETVIYDYMKTNMFDKNNVDSIVHEVLNITNDVSIAKKVETLFSVKEEYIITALNVMKKMCGSIDNYLYEILNITDDMRKEIKNKFLIN